MLLDVRLKSRVINFQTYTVYFVAARCILNLRFSGLQVEEGIFIGLG